MSTPDAVDHVLPDPQLKWSDHWKRTSNQLQRLHWALSVAGPRIRNREPRTDALVQAVRHLQQAEDALKRRIPDIGWAKLHAALELECMVFSDAEIDAKADELIREVDAGAVTGWEASAIKHLLESVAEPRGLPPGISVLNRSTRTATRRMQLRHALRLRNGFFGYAYYVERIIAYRRLILVFTGMALLVGALILLLSAPVAWNAPDYRIALGSAVAGMVGAVTSASQRLVVHPDTAAPVDVGSFTALVVRLFIGAVAALSVYLAELGGFVTFPPGGNVAMIFLASFGVGFAERLVVYHPPQAAPHPPAGVTGLPRRV